MKKSKYITKIALFIILILLGIAMFILGEYDDSPGAQLIGVVLVTASIAGIIKNEKKISHETNK